MAMKWLCWYCKKDVTQADTCRLSCPHCHTQGSDGWAVDGVVSEETLARLKNHRMDPINDLKVPSVVKDALREIKKSVEDVWKEAVKELKLRAKVDAKKIKLLQQELKLAEKEILRLQHALEIRR